MQPFWILHTLFYLLKSSLSSIIIRMLRYRDDNNIQLQNSAQTYKMKRNIYNAWAPLPLLYVYTWSIAASDLHTGKTWSYNKMYAISHSIDYMKVSDINRLTTVSFRGPETTKKRTKVRHEYLIWQTLFWDTQKCVAAVKLSTTYRINFLWLPFTDHRFCEWKKRWMDLGLSVFKCKHTWLAQQNLLSEYLRGVSLARRVDKPGTKKKKRDQYFQVWESLSQFLSAHPYFPWDESRNWGSLQCAVLYKTCRW